MRFKILLSRVGARPKSFHTSFTALAAYYAANVFRSADHDPLVIGFCPLLGDFNDGVLDSSDHTALLATRDGSADPRMDRDDIR